MTDTDHVLTHGYTVTAEFCGHSQPRAVVRQYGKWVSQHATRAEAFEAIEERGGARPWLYRGDHKLGHQSQQVGWDLHATTIVEHLGQRAQAYHCTPEQVAETGHEYLLYTPSSSATNWTAFDNREDFEAWLDAYGCRLNTGFEDIPTDFEPQPLDGPDEDAIDPAQCGTCKRWWDDGVTTGRTPTPSGRCPFEYFHELKWPGPGESFQVVLPRHEDDMAPLDQRADD